MIRVLIADDHPIVRAGLCKIISEDSRISVIDEAADGHEVIDKVRSTQYDVVVLDISMPGLSGIQVLKQLRSEKIDTSFLILSVYPEEQYAVRLLKAGAAGYLTKEAAPEELINAIRRIASGKRYISPTVADKLVSYLNVDEERPLHDALSDREYTVLLMIASGKTVKEISEELVLSVKTVHTYRTRILAKMNMKTNAELVAYAASHGLYPSA